MSEPGELCECRKPHGFFGAVTPLGRRCLCPCHVGVAPPTLPPIPRPPSGEYVRTGALGQPHRHKEEIVRRWEEGETFAEIAPDYDCTPSAIAYHVRKVHPEARAVPAVDPWRNVFMYLDRASGATYAELARRHHLSRGRVGQIVYPRPYWLERALARALELNTNHQVERVLAYARVLW